MAEAVMTDDNSQSEKRIQLLPTKLPVLELKIFCENEDLKKMYEQHIKDHNEKLQSLYTDSGFDLLNPSTIEYSNGSLSNKYSLGVKVALNHCSLQKDVQLQNGEICNLLRVQPHAFMLLPRSSTGLKTNLRLSNNVGVIDSGYRGEITALVDILFTHNSEFSSSRNKLESGKRNFQLVSFNGYPMHVNLVDTLEDLGNTDRGEGGFGSTGN